MDAPTLEFNKTVCLVGNRNSGKTNAATALILMPGLLGAQSDVIIAFCNGASYLQWKFLEGPRLPHKVYPELKEGVIEECFKTNEQRLAKGKEPVRFLLIFDDSLSKETVHNKIINRVFLFIKDPTDWYFIH